MTQARLTCLSVMSLEHDILRQPDFDKLTSDFANKKVLKVSAFNKPN